MIFGENIFIETKCNTQNADLCSISIPIKEVELIWGEAEMIFEEFDIEEE